MLKFLRWFLVSVAVVILSACGGGGGGSKIELLSPSGENVEYSYVTLEVKDSVDDVKAKVNGVEYEGIKNGTSFLIYNVALSEGKNDVELVANSGADTLTVEINSENKGFAPIGINADKREGFEKLDTTLSVQTSLNVSEYRLDKENDGVVDESGSNGAFSVSYDTEGRFFPVATVKTSDGVLYSSQRNVSLDIKAKPTVQSLSSLSSLDVIDMQMFSSEKYYVLTSASVYEINASNEIINTINIDNANSPEGFFVDMDENIFIANTGANQVIKLSKDNSYQQTLAFGTDGSANGEFSQPRDIVVESSGDSQKIYVLDAGNNRIQVFNYVGAYLYAFDGSTTPTGKLNNPTSMVGYFAQPLVIVDSGNGAIRTLQCSQGQAEHEVSVIKEGISSNLGKITIGSDLIVADKGAKKILFFQNNHWLKKSIDTDKVPNIAISSNGLSVMVANEGESGVSNIEVAIDPIGAEPMDVAKAFVKNIIVNDRIKAKQLLYTSGLLDKIYNSSDITQNYILGFSHIVSWEQRNDSISRATVIAHIKVDNNEGDFIFVLDKYTASYWVISKFDDIGGN